MKKINEKKSEEKNKYEKANDKIVKAKQGAGGLAAFAIIGIGLKKTFDIAKKVIFKA